MARTRNSLATVKITISTTEFVESYLEALVDRGLFGKNAAEAAERLVARAIETRLEDGGLKEKKHVARSRRR